MAQVADTPQRAGFDDLIRQQAYVDGRWLDADSGETFPVLDPATGQTLATRLRRRRSQ